MGELYRMSQTLLTILLWCCIALPMAKSIDCPQSLVKCAMVECEGGDLVTPKGKCCPECVPRKVPTSSSSCLTSCQPLTCPDGVQHVPAGECCPVCGPACEGVTCPNVDCSNGHLIQFPEYCCPICFTPATTTSSSTVGGTSPMTGTTESVAPPDCGGVTCRPLTCPGGVEHVPAGQCCPVCGPECTGVSCPNVDCSHGEFIQGPGDCCAYCITPATSTSTSPMTPPNCEGVTCLPLTCPGGVEHVPAGQCCPVCGPECTGVSCPNVDCSQGELIQGPGDCCAYCITTASSSSSSTTPMIPTTEACPELDCDIGFVFTEGKPCPECADPVTRPDCGGVTCPPLDCPTEGSTLPEYCCPVCVTTNLPEPQNCTETCDRLSCTYGVYRPALSCCEACIPGPEDPPANCQTVTCPFVECVGGIPMTSPGDCCVSCAFP